MKQPSTRRLFSYKLVKTACAGCKKSRKAQRHETAFRLAKSSSASKHHGCQRRGKTVSASLSRPRSRQRRLRARRPQYQQYHGARRRVLPYRHGRVVHGHRNVRFFENLVLYGLRRSTPIPLPASTTVSTKCNRTMRFVGFRLLLTL